MNTSSPLRAGLLALILGLGLGGAAQAACYADYKASRPEPFALQYGVAEIYGPCDAGSAWAELGPRLAVDGLSRGSGVAALLPKNKSHRRPRVRDLHV